MARLVRDAQRRRNRGGFGRKSAGAAEAEAGLWGEVPGMYSFLVKCGTRVVGTAMSIQTHPGSVLACFDAVTHQAPSSGCRHFPSQAMARAWLSINAKMVKC